MEVETCKSLVLVGEQHLIVWEPSPKRLSWEEIKANIRAHIVFIDEHYIQPFLKGVQTFFQHVGSWMQKVVDVLSQTFSAFRIKRKHSSQTHAFLRVKRRKYRANKFGKIKRRPIHFQRSKRISATFEQKGIIDERGGEIGSRRSVVSACPLQEVRFLAVDGDGAHPMYF